MTHTSSCCYYSISVKLRSVLVLADRGSPALPPQTSQKLLTLDLASTLKPAAMGTGGESSGLFPRPGAPVTYQTLYSPL